MKPEVAIREEASADVTAIAEVTRECRRRFSSRWCLMAASRRARLSFTRDSRQMADRHEALCANNSLSASRASNLVPGWWRAAKLKTLGVGGPRENFALESLSSRPYHREIHAP